GSLWATRASSAASLASSLSPSEQIANSRAIRASVGAGLIWASPFGALRVDYAYPVAKQNEDGTQLLNFSAGMFLVGADQTRDRKRPDSPADGRAGCCSP